MNHDSQMGCDEYRTTDIYLASYLIAGKHTGLSGIESTGDKRKTFVLTPAPSQEQIQSFYSRHEASRIVARDVLEELRNLKGMIQNHDALNKGGAHA